LAPGEPIFWSKLGESASGTVEWCRCSGQITTERVFVAAIGDGLPVDNLCAVEPYALR